MKLKSLFSRLIVGLALGTLAINGFVFYLLHQARESGDFLWLTTTESQNAYAAALFFLTTLNVLFISYWVRKCTRPLSQTAEETVRIGDSHYEKRVSSEEYGSKEIAQIRKFINQTVSKVEQLNKAMDVHFHDMTNVMSSLGEGLVAVDDELRVRFINPRALKILGFESSKRPPEFAQEAFRHHEAATFIKEALKSNTAGEIEISFDQASLEEKRYQLRRQPYQIDEDHRGVIILLLDITEMKKLESYRKDFVANVSHELRTPLTTIKGFSETLQSMPLENVEKVRQFSKIISDHVNRLAALVDDLLTLSKMESQSQDALNKQMQKTKMSALIPHAIAMVERKAKIKNIQVEAVIKQDAEKPVIPHLFEQALINLLDNAINYSPENAKVTLILDSVEGMVKFHVIDNGPGIEAKHIPRLFERFYRVDEGRNRSKGGTGIGLALVKHIAQMHGGNVSVHSAPGDGSHFILELP